MSAILGKNNSRESFLPFNFNGDLCVERRGETSVIAFSILLKGKLNPEMKLCELLVLGHCIHLRLILFACASSGQSYNISSPVAPSFCDVIDTAMTGDPIAFWSFLNFYRKVLFWSLHASSIFIFTLLRVSGKDLKSWFALEVDLKRG